MNICPNCGAWGDVGAGHACISTGAAAQPAQEPVTGDDDSDALTIAYMQGFSDGKTAARASTPSSQESAAAAWKDAEGVDSPDGEQR
jgi:hypothetical protein